MDGGAILVLLCLSVCWSSVDGVVSPADIIILLDSSDSSRSANFEIEERFAVQLVKGIYTRENQIGLFTFGERTHDQFYLNSYNDIQQINQAVKYMWYSTGDGLLAPAINFTLINGFTESRGDRECIPNILIVLTHSGIADPSTATELGIALSDKSIGTFVLNMAAATVPTNLDILTNDTTRVITIGGYQDLPLAIPGLLQKLNDDLPSTGCGQLTQWQPWTRCSVSCGKGLKFRLRHCLKEHKKDKDCVGDLSKDAECTAPACTDPIDGRWANWNSWSVCTKTCNTGLQTRTRDCAAPMPLRGGKPCPGPKRQQQNCSEWQCPDCNKTCPPGGHLSKDCQICECSSATLFGRITDERNLPVEKAEVYLESRRYKPIANTDQMGRFSIGGICLMNEKIFTSARLHASTLQTPSQLNSTHWTINGTLEKYIPPVFTVQPHDKSRMVGQSFSVCCVAVGNPKPSVVTWFKDDIVLENEGTNGTLVIPSALKSHAGSYKCSAETLAGVSQSDEAEVTISDFAADTCGAPIPRLERLPEGCFLSGDTTKNNTLDVGTCGGRRCMTSSLIDNGTCSDWWPHYCCDSHDVEELVVDCHGFSYKTTRVKTCQCKLCIYRTTISGRAFGRNNSEDIPLQLASVYVGGKQITRTNMAGFFKFDVPKGSKRVVATFHDTYFKNFIDVTKIITVTDGEDVYASIVVPLKPIPIPFNTSHPTDIPLGGGKDGLASVASLTIHKDSFLTSDGQVFRGSAKASIHFMDPRDRNSLDTANGEFVSETSDGQKAPLKTFGMFQLGVTDTAGNSLQVHKPIDFTLDGSLFNVPLDKDGNPDIALWDYDENKGIWVENTKLRFATAAEGRRKLLQSSSQLIASLNPKSVPEIDPYIVTVHTERVWTGRYTNCDQSVPIYEDKVQTTVRTKEGLCYVSVSVYSDMSIIETFSKGSVTITAYTQEPETMVYIGKNEMRMLKNGHACLLVFCDKIVTLKATSDGGDQLIVAKHNLPTAGNTVIYPIKSMNDTEVQFESRNFGNAFFCQTPPCRGPVYPYSENRACDAASNDNTYRFNFAFFTKPPVMNYAVSSPNVYDKKLSWYPVSPDKATFRSCFFKVFIKVYETYDIRLFAISHLRTFNGEQFGTHIVGPTPKPRTLNFTLRGACLEFRCPGYLRDGGNEVFDAATAVEIHVRTANTSMFCKLKIPSQLQSDITPLTGSQGDNGLRFMARAGVNYGSSYGIFINDAHKNDVEKFCKTGLDTGPTISGEMDPTKNPAVEFDCLN